MSALSSSGVSIAAADLLHLKAHAQNARRPLSGFTSLTGGFASRRLGRGLEPADVRLYVPGDDVRHLDRHATARTSKLHVRGYRDERDRSLMLLADFRSAMLWGTRGRLRSVGAALALALAGWCTSIDGGRVGALLATNKEITFEPPRARDRGMIAICGALAKGHTQALSAGLGKSPWLSNSLRLMRKLAPRGSHVLIATSADDLGNEFDVELAMLNNKTSVSLLLITDAFETNPISGTYAYRSGDNIIRYGQTSTSQKDDPRIDLFQKIGVSVTTLHSDATMTAMLDLFDEVAHDIG